MGRPLPEYPTLFAKFPHTLTGPYEGIEAPPEDEALDWEAELTVVLGATVRRVYPKRAAEAIAHVVRDEELIVAAHEAAWEVVGDDPDLDRRLQRQARGSRRTQSPHRRDHGRDAPTHRSQQTRRAIP